MTTVRPLPQDLEAEASVLGAILIDPNSVNKVADFLKAEDFNLDNHGYVYRAILSLWEQGKPLDVLAVRSALKAAGNLDRIGGEPFLAELQDGVPTAANIEHYGRLVADAAVKRGLIHVSTRIANLGYAEDTGATEAMDAAQSALFALSEGRSDDSLAPIKQPLADAWEELGRIHEDHRSLTGIPSGFVDLDEKTGGFQKSDLIILAARPGVGKTSFVLNVTEHVAIDRNLPVGIFSLEMSARQLIHRLICGVAGVDASAMKHGTLTSDGWARVTRAVGRLGEAPIFIDQSAVLSVMQLRAKARRLKGTSGLGLIVVDYLQLMESRTKESREREVAEISRGLKGLARELNIPIIACAQLNREAEKRADHRPQLGDLRDSGGLEQDSDLVLFLYREKLYNPSETANDVAELLIAKHRNGPTGLVNLLFIAEQTKFRSYRKPQEGDRG